jgi:6-phosphogluconolactonase
LRAGGSASLVVSGGRSPTALFEQLSSAALDWRRVWIALTDERWTPPTNPDSNEQALADGPADELPMRAILRQTLVPVDVYWCPEHPTAASI